MLPRQCPGPLGRRTRSSPARGAAVLGILAITSLFASCSGDGDIASSPGTPATPPATATPSSPDPEPEPITELRVAFINLFSPLTNDENNQIAGDTSEARLELIIRQLKVLNPDIVGFNEASRTKQHGDAIARLARELKMEFTYARANPWYPGQDKAQSDDQAKALGFEEGELILVRGSRFPVLRWERKALNPRTTEFGEGRASLHVVVKGPLGVGEIDVFITHLTGGGDAIRKAQAQSFANIVLNDRGNGPAVVMVGQSDPSSGSTYEVFKTIALREALGPAMVTTCCRASVVGEQPAPVARTDYLMSLGLPAPAAQLFADTPDKLKDGSLLYSSDHNGLFAIFPLPAPTQ